MGKYSYYQFYYKENNSRNYKYFTVNYIWMEHCSCRLRLFDSEQKVEYNCMYYQMHYRRVGERNCRNMSWSLRLVEVGSCRCSGKLGHWRSYCWCKYMYRLIDCRKMVEHKCKCLHWSCIWREHGKYKFERFH